MTGPDGPPARRIRPHVARAVARTNHVLLDFDGVMFDVEAVLGRWGRENVVHEYLGSRPYFPRPLTIGAFGMDHMLGYIAEEKPDYAVEAEESVASAELDAALTSRPTPGLRKLLAVCTATQRRVGVVSDLSEDAVTATLRSHELLAHIDAISARQGLDLAAFNAAHAADRAADLLGVPIGTCLFVGTNSMRIANAQSAGAICLGSECGHERRKNLASMDVPVIPNHATLTQALLDTRGANQQND